MVRQTEPEAAVKALAAADVAAVAEVVAAAATAAQDDRACMCKRSWRA